MKQIIQLIDSFTKENVNYEESATWHDGTPLDNSKVDNVIYRKKGTSYYKRSFSDYLDVKWFGAMCDGITDDTIAVQKAIDMCQLLNISLNISGICKIEGELELTKSPTLKLFRIFSNCGGGFTKNNAGYVFNADKTDTSSFEFRGLNNKINNPACFINGNKIIIISISSCYFQGSGGVIEAKDRWLQSCKIYDNIFRGGDVPLFDFAYSFDCTFSNNTVEATGAFVENTIETPLRFPQNNLNLRIINNCMQSLKTTGIRLGRCNTTVINSNYFELNGVDSSKSYINLSLVNQPHRGVMIMGNIIDARPEQVSNNSYAIDWGTGGEECTSIGNRTNLYVHNARHIGVKIEQRDLSYFKDRIKYINDYGSLGISLNNITINVPAKSSGNLYSSEILSVDGLWRNTIDREITSTRGTMRIPIKNIKYISLEFELSCEVDDIIIISSTSTNVKLTRSVTYTFNATTNKQKFVLESLPVKVVDENEDNILLITFSSSKAKRITFSNCKIFEGDVCGNDKYPRTISAVVESNRPQPEKGLMVFDETLGYPVFGTGSNWVRAIRDATTTTSGLLKKADYVPNSTASSIESLVTEYNNLLTKLRNAGIIT